MQLCARVADEVGEIIPAAKLEAIVLGGGYGRGEGGVLKTAAGDQPYNDLEFYVFVRGNRLVNERNYRGALEALGEKLSPAAGLHVEFKVDSIMRLERSPVSMFSYDLVSGHRTIAGDEKIFSGCEHHKEAKQIPLHEATRLLFNRCSGLLFAKNYLREKLDGERADFVGRNLAKAQLALGDVLLAALGQYHWSVRERAQRVKNLNAPELPLSARKLQEHHTAGAEFKLHPTRINKSAAEFAHEHAEISECAQRLWVWLEAKRLKWPFVTTQEYALSEENKCPETSGLKNLLINARVFGSQVISMRYPRERLLQTLPLLLWQADLPSEKRLLLYVQSQLQTNAASLPELVAAYERLWRRFN